MKFSSNVANSKLYRRALESMQKVRALRQRGYSMIEIAIAVVIVGAVLAVTVLYVRTVLSDNKVNDELKELPIVVTRIQKMYANAANYNGISTAIVARSNVYPPERVNVAAGTILNRWNGNVTVGTANANMETTLTYTAVSRAECIGILPQLSNVMNTITVAGVAVKTAGNPVDPALVATNCANNVTVVYNFTK